MSHIISTILGFVFIIITRRLYYRNFELFLCLLIVINFNFFHLLPRIGQFDIYRETVIIVILFYTLEIFVFSKIFPHISSHRFTIGRFGGIVLFYLFLILFGFIVATIKGQPMVLGIKAIKWYPTIFIFFIVLVRKINATKFFQYFVLMASILSILVSIQYALFHHFHFFYFYDDAVDHIRGIGQIRGLRILEGNSVIVIGCLLSIAFYIQSRRLIWIGCASLMLFTIVIVMQVRSQIVAIIISSLFVYFIHNKVTEKKIIVSFFIICLLILSASLFPLLSQISFLSENRLLQTTLRDFEGISRYGGFGNINIRLLCLENYWTIYKQNWLLGRGILNINWPGNIDYYFQQSLDFHLIDLGVFHFMVNHGVLGGIFLTTLFIVLFPQSVKLNQYPLLATYFIGGFILMPIIDLFFRFDRILLFGIFLGLMDHTFSKQNYRPNRIVKKDIDPYYNYAT